MLHEVELNDLRLIRTINSLNSSQLFRLKVASYLLKKPDLVLIDHSFEETSFQDLQFLIKVLKTNQNKSIIVINSSNEDFIQNVVTSVVEIGPFDVSAVQYNESYAQAQSHSQEKKVQTQQAAAGYFNNSHSHTHTHTHTHFLIL